jgi:hydroxymethylglutaryl-CoA reductase
VYRPLAVWRLSDDAQVLEGCLELPMALGTVGGATRVHPGARLSLALLGVSTATEFGMVAACVGLASNLAALRALASEGIQRGHMSLHARTVARGVGATGELVELVAEELARTGDVRAVRAAAILERLRAEAAQGYNIRGALP